MRVLANPAVPVPRMKIYHYLMRGLEQQMWFFGQDVRHGSNLLARYGFLPSRETGLQGSSRYRFVSEVGLLELHSFCVGLYREKQPGFIFVRGRMNAYLHGGKAPPHPGRYLGESLAIPRSEWEWQAFQEAAGSFLGWVLDYERWIDRLAGENYRRALQPHCPMPWLAPESARAWLQAYREAPDRVSVPRRKNFSAAIAPRAV